MRRKNRNKKTRADSPRFVWLRTIPWKSLRRPAAIGAVLVTAAVAVFIGSAALARLNEHVHRTFRDQNADASIEFVDLPESLIALAGGELRGSISELLKDDWTDESRCREIADRLSSVGWIAKVNHVRRTPGGRFEVSARYRLPAALVAHRNDFVLVDADGVRLPGLYVYHPRWYIIDGVEGSAPSAGEAWLGADLQAGLIVLKKLRPEPFRTQIVGVDVGNFRGRRDSRASHLSLITDRPGGRIRWGSAPGFEVEENQIGQKLALLRQNFLQTGRADAGYDVIDISTFPDRFHIPG